MGQDQSDQSRYVIAPPRFVLLGDSLTDQSKRPGGWSNHLAWKYTRRAEVVTRGFSGYTTRWLLHALDAALPPGAAAVPGLGHVALVTVLLGTNDSVKVTGQHVPIDEYRSNLNAIVSHLRKIYGKHVEVVLMTPPPIDDVPQEGIDCRDAEVAEYAKACQAAAIDCGVPCLDLRSAFLAAPSWQDLLSDGVHFQDAGDRFLADVLIQFIEKEFPHLAPPIEEQQAREGEQPLHALPLHLPQPYWVSEESKQQCFIELSAETARAGADAARTLEVPVSLRKQ